MAAIGTVRYTHKAEKFIFTLRTERRQHVHHIGS